MKNFQSFFSFSIFPLTEGWNFFLILKISELFGVGKGLKDPTPCLLFLSLSTFFSFKNPGLGSSCSYFIPSAFLMFFLLSSFHLLLWFFPLCWRNWNLKDWILRIARISCFSTISHLIPACSCWSSHPTLAELECSRTFPACQILWVGA